MLVNDTAGLEDEATTIGNTPPEVLVSPMAGQTVNVAPTPPTYVAFYTPAALALLLRHLAVTLIALSLVRDRTLGAVELFRVSPVSPRAILLGKTVAFAALALALAALLVLLFHAVGIVKLHRELRLG